MGIPNDLLDADAKNIEHPFIHSIAGQELDVCIQNMTVNELNAA